MREGKRSFLRLTALPEAVGDRENDDPDDPNGCKTEMYMEYQDNMQV